MIKGINITKRFGNNMLFEDMNFVIEKGEFVCFSGESGTGKTTLLNMIGMIEPFDEGKILIHEKEIKTAKEKRYYYQKEVGFLFQNFALVDYKTVKENLKLIQKKNRTKYSFEEALDMVGLADKLDSYVYTLSGGEQQRVALARLFLKQCEIVLADEPTGSLDSKNADVVVNILEKLNREGKTIVLVSHDERIKGKAKRIIEL